MVRPSEIKAWIEEGLSGSSATVDGDGHHFDAIVVCSDFAGKSVLQQHRMVYEALGDKMQALIHALSIKTRAQ